jgi:putative endopeptidase
MHKPTVFRSGLAVTLVCLAVAAGQTRNSAFDVSNLDKDVSACGDFNQFANGGWMAKNPIPTDEPAWGSFNELIERNRDTLRQILEAAAKKTDAAPGSGDRKIGDFYGSCMDEANVERQGIEPLRPELARIKQISGQQDLVAEIAHLHGLGVNALFSFNSTQDYKNSEAVIATADQGGMGLPDRDYYTKEDEKSKQLRSEYVKHVTRMFQLMGDSATQSAAEADTVLRIEAGLARAAMTATERRDPEATYHKLSFDQLKTLTPNFTWQRYFAGTGFAELHEVDVTEPNFFKEVNKDVATMPLAEWKIYLRWHLIHKAAPSISSKFVDEDFNFNGKVLAGIEQNLPRWKRCVAAVDGFMGEALGQGYVQTMFSPAAKARMLDMVQKLVAALREDIPTLSWMGDATKKQAITKLEAFARKIGYPDKWRDYSSLQVDRGPYVENVMRAVQFEFKRQLGKIGKPLDRTEWGMSPPTVNAYYNPSMNEIVFPAGILQPPFFDPQADDALNYGAIGVVIGHEMTHGFDDQGAKFDAKGNLQNWWAAEDLKNFQARGECIANQFSGFKVEEGLHENGKLVEGESIADLGGLAIAYAAFLKSLEGKPHPPAIDGFTPEQRFFLGYARIWSTNIRPEFARLLVTVDPHPLPRFRVNGPLSNMPAFAQAFSCKEDDAMERKDNERCLIW